MKARDLFSKVLAFALAAAMLLGMLPVFASAEEAGEDAPVDSNGLETVKTVTVEDDGTYTIQLEAWATGSVTTSTTTLPCDIVLVLDMSSSMKEDFGSSTRIAALKTAVQTFADSVYTQAKGADGTVGTSDDVNHRVSIVTFWNGSSIKCGLKNMASSTNKSTVDTIISGLSTSQGTVPADGLNNAITVFGDYSGNDAVGTETRQRVVVFFTDGYPSTSGSSNFTASYANNAIVAANTLKNTWNAKIYSVAVLDDADPTADFTGLNNNTKKVNCFLHAVSSNYPSATATAGSSTFNPTMGTRAEGDYYLSANSPEELNTIFTTISNSVGSPSIDLGSTAVMSDIIAPTFTLPEGFGEPGSTATVEVYTAPYIGNDSFGTRDPKSATIIVNGVTQVAGTDGITVTVGTDADGKDAVDITGFDYSANYCVDQSGTVQTAGNKIIVVISGIQVDPDAFTAGEIATNDAKAGIYQDGEKVEVIENFNECQVLLTSKTYVLDYAKSFNMAILDWGMDSVRHIAATPAAFDKDKPGTAVDMANGRVDLSGDTYTYTPQTTNWKGYDRFYAFGTNANKDTLASFNPLWAQVNVIPANNVYYEDTFVTSEDNGTVGIVYSDGWTVETVGANAEDVNGDVHGWVEDLADDTGDSDGTSTSTTAKQATATFTFTGTGMDIYARTTTKTGVIIVKVTNNATTKSKYYIVDTLAESNGETGYYNVPVISYADVHGEYTVTITVTDNGQDDRCLFVLDGIRIYNPLAGSDIDSTVEGAYGDELNAVFTEVKSLISKGMVFIDKTEDEQTAVVKEYNADEYNQYGPENEVYLQAGDSFTFKLGAPAEGNKYAIGLKALNGEAVTAKISNGDTTAQCDVNSSVDLYYNIVPNADGTVTVENVTGGILAVTKIRVTNPDAAGEIALLALTDEEALAAYSAFSAREVVAYTAETEPVAPETEPEVEEPTEPEIVIQISGSSANDERMEELENFVRGVMDAFRGWFGR